MASETVPDGLGTRGAALWRTLASTADLDAAGGVLALEACRCADRLERLDEILRGDVETWASLVHDLRTEDYELKIDGAMSEARQQQLALRAMLVTLGAASLEAKKAGGSTLDQLAAKREARGATTSDLQRPGVGQ